MAGTMSNAAYNTEVNRQCERWAQSGKGKKNPKIDWNFQQDFYGSHGSPLSVHLLDSCFHFRQRNADSVVVHNC